MRFELHNPLKLQISKLIYNAFIEKDPTVTIEELYSLIGEPPKEDMGEIAFPCFSFAKKLKMGPPQIAKLILDNLKEDEVYTEAKIFGPYLNFYLNPNYLFNFLFKSFKDESYFKNLKLQTPQKTMIEYSQPNTHKELHVGHMRNLCLGDAIINLYRYAQIETISTTFPGDVGTHIAKCLWYYKNKNKEPIPPSRKGAWLGSMYSKSSLYLDTIQGSSELEGIKKEFTTILSQIEKKDGPYFDLWKETRQWSIELLEDVYNWTETKFDKWYWESDVDSDSIKYINKLFKEGKLIKDQGAIGINLDEKLGFCMLLKSDGTGLYASKDVELARRKFEDYNIEKNIYIVDNRQAHHFAQVFQTLDKLGFENAKNCYHLQYEMVELIDGAMSSRKGNIVPLQELIDDMEQTVKEQYLNRYKDSWSQEEINHTAKIISQGAIKFGMTKVDSLKKIVFQKEEWLKLDGESGPYIQYVYARIQSLLLKANEFDQGDISLLDHPLEKSICYKLICFNDIIENCILQNKTHFLTSHLYQLAKLFNSYYADCKILADDNESRKNARLELCSLTAKTLKHGLKILGINSPAKM